MTLIEYLQTKPKKHLVFDFAGVLSPDSQQSVELIQFIQDSVHQYTFYIWSSSGRRRIEDYLQTSNLLACFKTIVTADDVEFYKPDIDGFYTIADPSMISKDEWLMIGDSDTDEQAARALGIDFFRV